MPDRTFELWPAKDNAAAAIATVTGTAIARFGKGRAAPAFSLLPVNRAEFRQGTLVQ